MVDTMYPHVWQLTPDDGKPVTIKQGNTMTKASKPTPKQNHPDQLDLIDYIAAKEAEDKLVSESTNTTKEN